MMMLTVTPGWMTDLGVRDRATRSLARAKESEDPARVEDLPASGSNETCWGSRLMIGMTLLLM